MSNLIDLESGFAIEGKSGRQEFRDDQVTNLQLSYIPLHSQGRLTGRIRTLFVWLQDQPKPIEFAEEVESGQTDELIPLIQRLSERLKERLSKDLDAGKSLSGSRFKLDRHSLTVGKAGKESEIRIDQLVSMAIVDDKLNIWRAGQDAPVLNLPFTEKNVYPLSLALDSRIPNQQTDVKTDLINNTGSESSIASSVGSQTGSQSGLGRCIFERKTTTGELVAIGFFAAVLVFLALQLTKEDNATLIYVFYGLAAALVLYGFLIRGNTFQCRERGVFRKTMFAKKELRYDQLEGFTFSKTSVFVNNVHQGFTVLLKFRPKDEFNGGSPITYKKNIKEEDTALESLCSQVSGILSQSMEQSLKKSGKVEWTKSLELRPNGIEYQASGLLGAKPAVTIPFEDILEYHLDDGEFRLWVKANPKTVAIAEQCSKENFFPGYELFERMAPA